MIRWPQDALTFAARLGPYACYAAGYIEGDCLQPELLGAVAGPEGTELVLLRDVPLIVSAAELELDAGRGAVINMLEATGVIDRVLSLVEAERDLGAHPALARVRDVLLTRARLQPEGAGADGPRVVVVEELTGNVHAQDLARRLFRAGTPPLGLALYIARALVTAMGPVLPLDIQLRRSFENVLLGWDGRVRVQPRVATQRRVGHVAAVGALLLELVTGVQVPKYEMGPLVISDLRSDVPDALAALIARAVLDGDPTLPALAVELDALLVEHPFEARDLAGVLAQLFPDDRAHDLAFHEDLAAGDLAALDLPTLASEPYDRAGAHALVAAYAAE